MKKLTTLDKVAMSFGYAFIACVAVEAAEKIGKAAKKKLSECSKKEPDEELDDFDYSDDEFSDEEPAESAAPAAED